MAPEAFVANASSRINNLGWVFYFAPGTMARGKELGLDGFRFYFLGRGGVLGDVEAPVVTSAFGYFTPALVEEMWTSGKAIMASRAMSPSDVARQFFVCSAELGRDRFADLDGLAEFCEAAGAINDAADPVGLALYSGIRAEPLVDDLPGRAMQLVTVLRELRGSAHLVAVRASGLDAKTAHRIRRPNDVGLFGWSENDVPEITDLERGKLAAADELTDQLLLPAYSAVDEPGRQAVLYGLDQMEAVFAATA